MNAGVAGLRLDIWGVCLLTCRSRGSRTVEKLSELFAGLERVDPQGSRSIFPEKSRLPQRPVFDKVQYVLENIWTCEKQEVALLSISIDRDAPNFSRKIDGLLSRKHPVI